MKTPSNLPTCEHGKIAGTSCKECYHRNELIRAEVRPLADEWWENRGKRDLNHQLYRAYRMGMKSTTPDPLAEKVDADFHLLEENISLRYRLDSQQKVIDAAIALLPHEGYLATRGTKEKSDFFIAVKALQNANNKRITESEE